MFSIESRVSFATSLLAVSMILVGIPLYAAQQKTSVVLLEATIDCGWGQIYTVLPGRLDTQQTQWVISVLGYINNGEVNREGFTFEERAEGRVSEMTMKALLQNPHFTAWAGTDVVQSLNELMVSRSVLLKQAPSFFDPQTMFNQPEFKNYWAARERALQRLTSLGVQQTDNGMHCD